MFTADKLICIFQILFVIVALNVELINCDEPRSSSPGNPAPSTEKKFQRLPTNVKPVLYSLSLKPDLKNFKFEATEIISVKIVKAIDKIILNCADIEIKSAHLKVLSTNEVLQAKFTVSADDEILNLQFTKALPLGDADLTIEYTGNVNDQGFGFFRAQYSKLPPNGEKYFAATDFEVKDARRCFPCWDEPAIKAEFDITLVVDADKMALSNMPVDKETIIKDGLKEVKFKRTPLMSTYLVAIVVGYFDFVEGKSKEGIPVKIYVPLGKKDQGKFALDLTTKALTFYSSYLNVPFPLPKLDSIAVDDMTTTEAMENWGLITYLESTLLDDANDTTEKNRRESAIVICHEVFHQWIGNLVTIEWWTYLWLQEGFAQFMAYLCADHVVPDYNIWNYVMTNSLFTTLESDAYPSTHAIEAVINDPSETELAFDNISYEKGASLLRTIKNFMGDELFRKGLTVYLNKYKYGNVVADNLWTVMEKTSSKPITKIMQTWTKQKGFPLVVVESSTQEANNVRKLVLSQKKFSADPNFKGDNTLWTIPLLFSKQSKSNDVSYSTLLEGQQMTVSIPDVSENEWVKINTGGVGFFRTKYPKNVLDKFLPSIQDKSMPILDRMAILDDLFALARCGEANTVDFLNLVAHMVDEDDSEIWTYLNDNFSKIIYLLLNTDSLPSLYKYGIQILRNIRNKVGYDAKPDDKRLTAVTRAMVLNLLFFFEDQDFAQVSLKRFNDHVSGTSVLPSSLRSVTYRAAISVDGERTFEGLKKLYRAATSAIEKQRIMASLIGIKDAKLVDTSLQFCLSAEVSENDFYYGIGTVAQGKGGRDATFEFIKKNYDAIRKKVTSDLIFSYIMQLSIKNFNNEEKIKEIQDFFATKNINISNNVQIQESLESIRINVAWLKRDGELIKKYLSNFKPTNSH